MENETKFDGTFEYVIGGRGYSLPCVYQDGERWFPSKVVGVIWNIKNPRRLIKDQARKTEMSSPKHFKTLYSEGPDGTLSKQMVLSLRGLIRLAMRVQSKGARDFREYMDRQLREAELEGRLPEGLPGKASDQDSPNTNAVIPFTFDSHKVRVIRDDDGSACFVAKDVCDALNYSNSRMVVGQLDDDESGVRKTYTASGSRGMQVVSESGLYTLIIRSNKPEAKKFRRWITHEVLPAIRTTGSYEIQTPPEHEALSPADKADTEYVLAVARRDAMMRGVLLADILRDYKREAIAKAVHFRRMGLTQRETGGALGLSRDQIRRMEARLRDVGVHFDPVPVNARNKQLKEKVLDNLIPFPERPEMAVAAIQ